MYRVIVAGQSAYVRRSQLALGSSQALLALAWRGGGNFECLCAGSAGAAVVPKRGPSGALHLARAQGTADLHGNGCPHSGFANLSAAYGAKPGTFAQDGDEIVINFELLCPEASVQTGIRGGGGKSVQVRSGLEGLGRLLPGRAGLDIVGAGQPSFNPWADLAWAADSMKVQVRGKRTRLSNMTLLHQCASPAQSHENRRMLREAAAALGSVLVCALLPAFSKSASGIALADFWPDLSAAVNLFQDDFARRSRRFSEAKALWKAGGDVLVIGVGKPKLFDSVRARASIRDFALIPVSRLLAPDSDWREDKSCVDKKDWREPM